MSVIEIKVPDIGEFTDVPVIEILVQPGDTVAPEDPLVTLESDKATMDVPAPAAGKVVALLVSIGDTVSEGSAILKLESSDAAPAQPAADEPAAAAPAAVPTAAHAAAAEASDQASDPARRPGLPPPVDFGNVHASPSVRMIARELGVDLTKLTGSGAKGRITKDDVKRAVAGAPAAAAPAAGGMGIPPIPAQDFSKFGPVEEKPLSRLKRLSGPAPPSRLAQRSPRHSHRRSRHNRTRRLSPLTRCQGEAGRLPRDAAVVPAQGVGRLPQGIPDLQCFAQVPMPMR